MNKMVTKGYDALCSYSVDELKQMYLHEGLTDTESSERAKIVKKEIDKLNCKEQRLWRNVRKNEITIGLDVDDFIYR